MSLLSEYVIETYRARLELRVLHTELGAALLYERRHSASLAYSAQVALHICHEARHACLAETLGQDLESYGLTCSCRAGYEAVAVGHISNDADRTLRAVSNVQSFFLVEHIFGVI